jgi:hypothetical protein
VDIQRHLQKADFSNELDETGFSLKGGSHSADKQISPLVIPSG